MGVILILMRLLEFCKICIIYWRIDRVCLSKDFNISMEFVCMIKFLNDSCLCFLLRLFLRVLFNSRVISEFFLFF